MAATDSLRAQPQREPGSRPPTSAEISAAEAQAAEETGAELDELIATEIDAALGPLAGKLAPLLERQLRWRAREDVTLRSPRRLADDLESWTEERLEALFAATAAGTAEILDEGVLAIERAHRERLEDGLARLGREADPLILAVRDVPPHPLDALEPTRFGSATPGRFLRRVTLPGPLGRRLVRRSATVRLRSALRRRAVRLRAQLASQVRDAVAGYRRELGARLGEEPSR